MFAGCESRSNRLQQRIASKWFEQHRDSLRALRQLPRDFIQMAGNHYHWQSAARGGERFAELHPIHLG